jgi:hypothetical protein
VWTCPGSFGTSAQECQYRCLVCDPTIATTMEAMLARLFRDQLTLWNLVVCALTAAKGVSGSGASMIAVVCGGRQTGRYSRAVEAEDCCVVL